MKTLLTNLEAIKDRSPLAAAVIERHGKPSAEGEVEPAPVRGDELLPVPDGFEYLGKGPLEYWSESPHDEPDLALLDPKRLDLGWRLYALGDSANQFYAARIGSKVWKRNMPPAPAPDAGSPREWEAWVGSDTGRLASTSMPPVWLESNGYRKILVREVVATPPAGLSRIDGSIHNGVIVGGFSNPTRLTIELPTVELRETMMGELVKVHLFGITQQDIAETQPPRIGWDQ
jgi:hypothetical protein